MCNTKNICVCVFMRILSRSVDNKSWKLGRSLELLWGQLVESSVDQCEDERPKAKLPFCAVIFYSFLILNTEGWNDLYMTTFLICVHIFIGQRVNMFSISNHELVSTPLNEPQNLSVASQHLNEIYPAIPKLMDLVFYSALIPGVHIVWCSINWLSTIW